MANHLDLLTTIIILDFASVPDSDGRPLGEAATVWEQVLSSISELPGWKSTRWGPRSEQKHEIIIMIVWQFLFPPYDFAFSPKDPLSQSSPLQPFAPILTSKPRILNIPLYPALRARDDQLPDATFELELLYLPNDTRLLNDRVFGALFCAMTPFVISEDNRPHPPPCDFEAGHRGWLLDDKSMDSMPVNVILLHYPSLEGERRFKDPAVPHRGMLQGLDHPERLYQQKFLDVLAGLAGYGVQRETIHFRLNSWKPTTISNSPRHAACCTIQ
ncbi:MAG: hypothetical protein Q9224_006179 [Gallowayella concinna]